MTACLFGVGSHIRFTRTNDREATVSFHADILARIHDRLGLMRAQPVPILVIGLNCPDEPEASA